MMQTHISKEKRQKSENVADFHTCKEKRINLKKMMMNFHISKEKRINLKKILPI